jgi:hypothetical protein
MTIMHAYASICGTAELMALLLNIDWAANNTRIKHAARRWYYGTPLYTTSAIVDER